MGGGEGGRHVSKQTSSYNPVTCTFSGHGKTFCTVSSQFNQKGSWSCRDRVVVSEIHNSIKIAQSKIV